MLQEDQDQLVSQLRQKAEEAREQLAVVPDSTLPHIRLARVAIFEEVLRKWMSLYPEFADELYNWWKASKRYDAEELERAYYGKP